MKDTAPKAAKIDRSDPRSDNQANRPSIARRLAVPLFLVVGLIAPLVISSWYTFSLQRQTLEEAFVFEMDQITRTLANGMAGPVWNLIPESGRPLLDSIMEDPRILSITVASDAQGAFLSATKDSRDAAQSIALTHDIVFQGGKIGTATLRIDTATMFAPMVAQWRRIGAVGAIQIAFIIAVVSLLIWFNNRWQRASALRQVNDRLEKEIAERTEAEQQLFASEARYRSIIENMVEAYFRTELDGKVVMVSPAVEDLVGHTPDETIGIKAIDLYVDREQHAKFLDDLAASDDGMRDYQTELKCKDGSTIWASINAQYVRDDEGNITGFEGTVRNVTEQKQAEQALVESHDQLRLITENMPANISYIDAEHRYRFANKGVEQMFGQSREQLIGRHTREVNGEVIFQQNKPRYEAALRGEAVLFEQDRTAPDGSRIVLQTQYIPHFDENGQVHGYYVLSVDVSEMKRAEEQLRHAQKMEAVGQLTGGVAHDFNNLLAVILGNAELLQDEIGGNSALSVIERSATRGAELTQRLLAFSRQQSLRPQAIDLADLMAGFDDLLHRTLGAPVEIVTEVPEGLWPVVADPGQLENAMLNLAINARDAMPNGGILEIRCANAELLKGDGQVSPELPAGDYVQIAVRDSGEGMSKDVREHAFEPFYTTKDVGEGTGLGLSMVYGFARQSGGDAVIASEIGKGTEITLFLPRAAADDISEEQTKGGSLERGKGQTILVLEDEPDVRDLALTILDGLGYRVFEASDANAAMLVLEEEADNIDLLLSDVVLPGGVNGPEFAAKAHQLYPKLKVIFMTGYTSDASLQNESIATGIPVLTKPFRTAALANAVHDTLETE